MPGRTSTVMPNQIPKIRQRAGRWKYPELFIPLRQGIAKAHQNTDPKEIRRRRDSVLRWAERQGLVIKIHTWKEHVQPDPAYPEILMYGILFVPAKAQEEADRYEAEAAAAEAAGLPTSEAAPGDGEAPVTFAMEIPDPEPQNPHRGHALKRAMDAKRIAWEKKMRPRDPKMPAMDP